MKDIGCFLSLAERFGVWVLHLHQKPIGSLAAWLLHSDAGRTHCEEISA